VGERVKISKRIEGVYELSLELGRCTMTKRGMDSPDSDLRGEGLGGGTGVKGKCIGEMWHVKQSAK